MANEKNNFWTEQAVNPKRKYRFKVEFTGIAPTEAGLGLAWYAKTCDKPEITVKTGEVNYMAHKFYYPGTVEWNEINLVLVDPAGDTDVASATSDLLERMGYVGPQNASTAVQLPTKSQAFELKIIQINAVGEPIETWTLKNAICTKLGFGQLDYSSEDLSEINMSFRYDWAEITDSAGFRAFDGS
tara:strand:+ start:1021 stop:1578 length:558 start_codon:yes stop_codon:yes gene_type:complete